MALLGLVTGLAFLLAMALGANDVANAMGTSVGSKALTLKQAIVCAAVFECMGAVLAGQGVTHTLMNRVSPIAPPGTVSLEEVGLGAIAVLLASALWLLAATWQGWPVASSHAAVAALAGVTLVRLGPQAVDLATLRWIGLSWLVTPLLSGAIAALLFAVLQGGVLSRPDAVQRWAHWSPWLSGLLVAILGSALLSAIATLMINALPRLNAQGLPYGYMLGMGFMGCWGMSHWTGTADSPTDVQRQLGRLQVVSACSVAFAHGSNDVGNAIAPLASYFAAWQQSLGAGASATLPLWILLVGGGGIISGLTVGGQRVIATVGSSILSLQPSHGFCAELGAATTVLLASHLGVPVSTTHALIGSVVGIGWVQGLRSLQWVILKPIALAWILTVPVSLLLAMGLFAGLRWAFI